MNTKKHISIFGKFAHNSEINKWWKVLDFASVSKEMTLFETRKILQRSLLDLKSYKKIRWSLDSLQPLKSEIMTTCIVKYQLRVKDKAATQCRLPQECARKRTKKDLFYPEM